MVYIYYQNEALPILHHDLKNHTSSIPVIQALKRNSTQDQNCIQSVATSLLMLLTLALVMAVVMLLRVSGDVKFAASCVILFLSIQFLLSAA